MFIVVVVCVVTVISVDRSFSGYNDSSLMLKPFDFVCSFSHRTFYLIGEHLQGQFSSTGFLSLHCKKKINKNIHEEQFNKEDRRAVNIP